MGVQNYDFAGWVTKNDLRCADGRTIRRDAFKDCDGKTVPLVWAHMHDSPDNVLGHVLLENRKDGVYGYGKTNETEEGVRAKHLVQHGDITSFSIYANQLVQDGGDVMHGNIREVSLVLAGANPGALIDRPILTHSDMDDMDESWAVIYNGEEGLELFHSDNHTEEKKEEEKTVEKDKIEQNELVEIYETLNDKQKDLVHALIGMVVTDNENDDEDQDYEEEENDEAKHSATEEGEEEMPLKHNIFEQEETKNNVLSHDDLKTLATDSLSDMKRYGTFKESFIAHAADYGLKANTTYPEFGQEIDALFPDYRALNKEPDWIKRDTTWVNTVMRGVHHTPFSRIKSLHADLTEDEARARGYIKGNLKKEEVFTLLKRTTDPQTIYKKQKLDRDDILDITDFDVVMWLRREMRMMLEEEIARAILIGDGRLPSSDDKIQESHVRPIMNDHELYSIKVAIAPGATDDETAKAVIRGIIKNRKLYKGTGNPVLFTTEDWLANLLLLEDGIGHSLYKTEAELATKLRVSSIVPVPVMEDVTGPTGKKLMGIIVNPADYNVGADKGGEINTFDDFDIDYNQQKYLIETRISGALTKPFSAMVIEVGA